MILVDVAMMFVLAAVLSVYITSLYVLVIRWSRK